jgi:diguanylate cyclase
MLKTLVSLVQSTEKLTTDVDTHNSELKHVGRTVEDLKLTGELEEIQHVLLDQIFTVIESNHRLEDDLICARYRLEEQARELDRTRAEARCDTVSGLSNRKALDESLHYLLLEHKRHGQPFALALADVDRFKWINDTHGHTAGDRVIRQVGDLLKQCVRTGDHVARFGGDEFAVLLPQTEAGIAAKIADRIRRVIERHNFDVGIVDERVAVTFSMGLATARSGDTADSLIERADRSLYRSKHSGRNQLFLESEEVADSDAQGSASVAEAPADSPEADSPESDSPESDSPESDSHAISTDAADSPSAADSPHREAGFPPIEPLEAGSFDAGTPAGDPAV